MTDRSLVSRDFIRERAVAHGYTARPQADGTTDLNEYVYAFAEEMVALGRSLGLREAEAIAQGVADKGEAGLIAAMVRNRLRGQAT